MMTIGQLAASAGISTRAVRHYHRLGLLPERPRRANGYREYEIKDLVLLLRVKRMTHLGLSLTDCAAAMADSAEQDLRELLLELLADLDREERLIRERKQAVQGILRRQHDLAMDQEVADLVALLRGTAGTLSIEPALTAANTAAESDLLEMMQATMPPDQFATLASQYRDLLEDTEMVTRSAELHRQFGALAEFDAGANGEYSESQKAVIASLATAMAEIAGRFFAPGVDVPEPTEGQQAAWMGFGESLSPAQLLCVQLAEAQISR